MIIIVDDERVFEEYPENADWVKYLTSETDALAYFAKLSLSLYGCDEISRVYLDYDLGDGIALDVVRFITRVADTSQHWMRNTHFYIHSQNPSGANNMKNRLDNAGLQATRIELPPIKRIRSHS